MNTEPEFPDHLDDLLREQFRGFAPEAPERVWSRIEARLPERRRRPLFWWWILGLGGLAGLGVWAYFVCSHITHPATGTEEQAVAAPAIRERPAEMHPEERGGFHAFEITARGSEARETSRQHSDHIHYAPSCLPDHVVTLLGLPAEQLPRTLPTMGQFDPLVRLNPTPVPARVPPLPSLISPVKNSRSGRFTLGLVAAPVWIFHKNGPAGLHHGGAAPAFSEQVQTPAVAWQTGVSLGYALTPHWRLETGLWRRSETLHSTHQATLRLMDGICLNPYDPGAKHFEFQYALRSSGATADVTVRISQVDSTVTMPMDEPFSLDMRTTRQTRSWTLPLSLSRSFGQGRWRGLLRGGLALDYTAETSVQVEHFSEMCVDLCFSSGLLPSVTLLPQQRFSIQYLFGAGLEYRLSPGWGIRIEPAFFGKKGRSALAANTGVYYHF